MRWIIPCLAVLLTLFSCKNVQDVSLPDYPLLMADTLYDMRVGEKFIIGTAENSCCQYGWDSAGALIKNLPVPYSLALDTIYYEAMDPDCAGCSSFTYYVFTCAAEDSVRLTRYAIPMSAAGAVAAEDKAYWQEHRASYGRNYLINIQKKQL